MADHPAVQSLWSLVQGGGFIMWPLMVCSVASWAVIFERLWTYRKLGHEMRDFHLQAVQHLLRKDLRGLASLCHRMPDLPTARLVQTALERLSTSDDRLRARWWEAVERKRLLVNQELKRYLWILGTIASASPFIGLFGTVVGVLRSFQDMAAHGSGGFAVVAAGISEALVATAVGIVVAVIAVMCFNAFQTRWSALVLQVKVQMEEIGEILFAISEGDGPLDLGGIAPRPGGRAAAPASAAGHGV